MICVIYLPRFDFCMFSWVRVHVCMCMYGCSDACVCVCVCVCVCRNEKLKKNQ